MAAHVVYSNGAAPGVPGTLFHGQKFWLAQKVPQRSRYIGLVRANGGEVMRDERQATIKIVDHARSEVIPDSYSYKYIELSVSNSVLESLADHVVGPPAGTIRKVGSTSIAAKSTRMPFTAEDDRILLEWVKKAERDGAYVSGNHIYTQLEENHPQHTWQSWKDRVKRISYVPPDKSNTRRLNVSDDVEMEQPRQTESPITTRLKRRKGFSDEEANLLFEKAKELLQMSAGTLNEVWEKYFDPDRMHTPSEWQEYWEKTIRPKYLARRKENSRETMRYNTSSRSQSPVPESKAGFTMTRAKHSRLDTSSHLRSPVLERDRNVIVAIDGPSPGKRVPALIPSSGNASRTEVLRSDPSEIQEASNFQALKEDQQPLDLARQSGSGNDSKAEVLRSDHSESQEDFHSTVEAQEDDEDEEPVLRKRKRKGGIPSSSPPPPAKRPRPREIPSTPDLSPIRSPSPWPNVVAPMSNIDSTQEREEAGEADELSGEESTQEDDRPFGAEASPVLSEYFPTPRDTQAILQAATQVVDLDVASPEGGWKTAEATPPESTHESAIEPSQDPPSQHPPSQDPPSQDPPSQVSGNIRLGCDRQSTEGSFRAKTQPLDLSVPDPTFGIGTSSDPLTEAHPTLGIGARNSGPRQTELNARLDAWIDTHVAAGRSAQDTIFALECTSLDHELADQVLEYMSRHEGRIPDKMRGVWTGKDDLDLGSTEGGDVIAVMQKHGMENFDLREQYLAAWRNTT